MLRLVRPAPEGQGIGAPSRRKGARAPSLSLTAEEVRHARAALRNTARAYGGFACLAAVMGLTVDALHAASGNRGRNLSGTFALRLARAAGVSVEAVLTGVLGIAGRCPTCGHRAGDGRIVASEHGDPAGSGGAGPVA